MKNKQIKGKETIMTIRKAKAGSSISDAEAKRLARRDIEQMERELANPDAEIIIPNDFKVKEILCGKSAGGADDQRSSNTYLRKFGMETDGEDVDDNSDEITDEIDEADDDGEDVPSEAVGGVVGGAIGAVIGGIGGLVIGGILGAALSGDDDDDCDDEEGESDDDEETENDDEEEEQEVDES